MHNSSNNHFSGLHAGAEHRQTHDVGAQDRMPTAHPHRGGIHKRAVILQVSKQVVEFQTTPHLIKMKGGWEGRYRWWNVLWRVYKAVLKADKPEGGLRFLLPESG